MKEQLDYTDVDPLKTARKKGKWRRTIANGLRESRAVPQSVTNARWQARCASLGLCTACGQKLGERATLRFCRACADKRAQKQRERRGGAVVEPLPPSPDR